jgi:hypothetical protein
VNGKPITPKPTTRSSSPEGTSQCFVAAAPAWGVVIWPWCDGSVPKSMGHLHQLFGASRGPASTPKPWEIQLDVPASERQLSDRTRSEKASRSAVAQRRALRVVVLRKQRRQPEFTRGD